VTRVTLALAGAAVVVTLTASCAPIVPPPREPTAAEIAPTYVLSDEPWTFHARPGRAIETPNFRLYTTVGPSLLNDRFPRFAELALIHYTTYLTELPAPTKPLETFVMGTRPQWVELTERVASQHASTYLQIQRGGYAYNSRAVYWDIGPHDTLQVAAHEGWHQYTQATFQAPLPIWLEEGLATYMEGFRWDPADRTRPVFRPWSNPERFDALRTIVANDRLFPLDELLSARPQDLIRTSNADTLTYYAQVWALSHFLAEGAGTRYRPGLQLLLREHASGKALGTLLDALGPVAARRTVAMRRGPGVFETYFTPDLALAASEYDAFVRAIVEPGARQNMIQGQSPLTVP
jgi:hypothetical protein